MVDIKNTLQNCVWDEQKTQAAILLAQGYNHGVVSEEVNCNRTTIWRWMQNEEFAKEVDKLSLMYGVASKAHRMRLINQAIRQFIDENGTLDTGDDTLLDYLKEARQQIEGVKLDIISQLTAIAQTAGSVEPSGPSGGPGLLSQDTEETE